MSIDHKQTTGLLTVDLKPCPFCGEMPDLFPVSEHREIVSIECNSDCTVRPSAHDGLPLKPEPAISAEDRKASAIYRWNQRA